MAAYLLTLIYGNENFGGYFSVDGSATMAVQDDVTYPIEPGPHHIDFYSTSDLQRKAGAMQATLYRTTSSSGAVLDEIQRRSAIQGLGDQWSIDVNVAEGQLLTISIRSEGKQLVTAPMYKVEDLDEETLEQLEDFFEQQAAQQAAEAEAARLKKEEEQEAERIRRATVPRRNPGKIIPGAIMMGTGFMGALAMLTNSIGTESAELAELIVMAVMFLGMGIVGLILFLSGMRKKIRP